MTDEHPSRRRFLKLGSAVVAAGLAGCNLSSSDDGPDPTSSDEPVDPAPTDTPAPTPTPDVGNGSDDGAESTETPLPEGSVYTEVYRETIDSVVLVRTGGGQGTGFVFDDSHVVTNAHVVGDASATGIRFDSGEWYVGDVVGVDPHSDLAAIAVDDRPSAAEPLPFVQSGPVIGQQVAAIGNPYDLSGSVTTGVVSGTDRLIPAPSGYRIPDAIQTDAAVNPGNSGGPLMSLDSRVVAVINSGGGENIAFGISAALTQRVVSGLIEDGEYDHSFAGISLTDVTPTIAAANDMSEIRGLIVGQVVSGGPAAGVLRGSEARYSAGQQIPVGGDILLAIDGTELLTSEDFWSYLALETRPGETVEFTLLRDGNRRTVSLELAARPEGTSY